MLICLVMVSAHAQKVVEKKLPFNPAQRVELDLKFGGNIRLNAWDKPEIYLKASVTVNGGRLNDALLIDVNTGADVIRLKEDFDQELLKQGRIEDCPANTSFRVGVGGPNGSHYVCSDITYEVYLPRQASVRVETINGHVYVTGLVGPLSVKSVGGIVDVTWPKAQGADVHLHSFNGNIHAEPAFHAGNKPEKRTPGGYSLEGQVNGGGSQVRLESVNNDIYLRTH